MIDATMQSLPVPLLLLIHLQILQYPKINNAEFDLHVFDAQKRELRARVKTMEELGYWLVGRVERAGVKKILPTYPCLKPTETTAFRTSFSKYLETLRQYVIRDNTAASVWWRDIQVRKSLLEECAGDKFLRLLVAFSTHVMVTQIRVKAEADIQPQARPDVTYATRLAFAQSSQREWMNTASALLYREQKLANLRAQLVSSASQSQRKSKYTSLSTSHLVALRDTQLQELLRRKEWRSGNVSQGQKTLMFFVGLTGLSHDPDDKLDILSSKQTSKHLIQTHHSNLPITPVQLQVLPVAAAHHPAHLRQLGKHVFQSAEAELVKSNSFSTSATLPGPTLSKYKDLYTCATYALRDYNEAEEHAHTALCRALRRIGEEKESLEKRLQDEVKRKGFDGTGRSRSRKGDGKTTKGLKAGLRLKTNSVKVKVKVKAESKGPKSVDIDKDFSFWEDKKD